MAPADELRAAREARIRRPRQHPPGVVGSAPQVHQRGEPEGESPVIVLDDIGIGVDKRRFAPCALDLESADAVV